MASIWLTGARVSQDEEELVRPRSGTIWWETGCWRSRPDGRRFERSGVRDRQDISSLPTVVSSVGNPALSCRGGGQDGRLHQGHPRRLGDSDPVVQRGSGPSDTTSTGPPSGHARADRSRRPGAAVSDGVDPPGGQPGPLHRHSRRGYGCLPAVAPIPALPGEASREAARYSGEDLLQVRRRQPGRLAQAEHGRAPGLLQQRGGRPES